MQLKFMVEFLAVSVLTTQRRNLIKEAALKIKPMSKEARLKLCS